VTTTSDMIRAVVTQRPGDSTLMEWTTAPVPVAGPRDCVVEVEACGVCMHDVIVRQGWRKMVSVEFPVILGHEVIGHVVEVGDEVRDFRVGDRVVTVQRESVCGECRDCRSGRESSCRRQVFLGDVGLNGGYADRVRIHAGSLVKVSEDVPLETAVAACVFGTNLNALRDVAKLTVGETVLFTGAGGGVAIHGVQLAARMGARVIGATSSPAKKDAILAAGADEVIVTQRGEDFSAAVLEATGGSGVDVVVENVGAATFPFAQKTAARHGRIVLIGEVAPKLIEFDLLNFRDRDLTLLSALSTNRNQLEDVVRMCERGLLEPIIARRLPMSEAARAHEYMESADPAGRMLLVRQD